jgi:hypothetical protein
MWLNITLNHEITKAMSLHYDHVIYKFLKATSEVIRRIITCVHAFMYIHDIFCSSHTGYQSTSNQDIIHESSKKSMTKIHHLT